MDSQVERIATAALLHDIGKFWQRTRQEPPYSVEEDGHFGIDYKHALWTGRFVEEYVGDSEIAGWARMHHDPDSRESFIISLADWLSSSERSRDPAQERGRPEAALLVNILSKIAPPGSESDAPETTHFPLARHADFAGAFMPSKDARCSKEKYADLWQEFTEALTAVESRTATHGTWLALVRRFTSRIPAATPTPKGDYVPDISLFDHCRTVAALASCFLADGMVEEKASEIRTALWPKVESHPALSEPVCHLVCGNVSGIQDFLYTIASRRAAKTLKGRSFALQLVADACAQHLCRSAGVPESCIIYNGGGRFYLLLPLGADVDDTAFALTQNVNQSFGGNLAVNVGKVRLTPNDFDMVSFSSKWREAAEEANKEKRRRYSRLAKYDYDVVFGFQDEGGAASQCAVCGREAEGPALESEEALCEMCRSYEKLGREVAKAKWLLRCKPSDHPEGINSFFARLGGEYFLARSELDLPDNDIIEVIQLGGFDPEDILTALRPPRGTALSYRLAARSWEVVENVEGPHIKTFEELAGESKGVKKLGVFRADVDNLGRLFATGLGEEASLSRVATLSALLKDFFEGYLDHLAQEEYRGEIGVLYAGGDDLFVVGAWNRVIDFALDLRRKFEEFCGGNPNFTLSGGVVIVDDHLPLRYAAEMAHHAENAAKHFKRNGDEKNALTLFDTAIGFEEMGHFQEFHELLVRLLKPNDPATKELPAAFLRRLYDVWESYRKERELIAARRLREGASLDDIKREARWQQWRWMLTYGLREFSKKHSEFEEAIEEVQRRLLDEKKPIEDRLGVPLRWTELLLREER